MLILKQEKKDKERSYKFHEIATKLNLLDNITSPLSFLNKRQSQFSIVLNLKFPRTKYYTKFEEQNRTVSILYFNTHEQFQIYC